MPPTASQSVLEPASDAARTIESLWWVLFVVSVVVLGVVLVLVLAGVLRARADRTGPTSEGTPPLGHVLVLGGGVAVPIVVLVVLFSLTVATLPAVSGPEEGEAAFAIEVQGEQWFWRVRYPEQEIVTANEIHIPVGTPVELRVTTGDVIHSFWVPQLNRKIDMVPGRTNSILLEADRAGVFRGQCAEFCGLQHANMAFFVVAEERAAFDEWVERSAQPAAVTSGPGLDVFMEEGCGDCHTIAGTPADGQVGPDLTHLASRRSLAAGTLRNTKGHLGGWILDPQAIKPGNEMPGLNIDGPRFQELLEYLGSLE